MQIIEVNPENPDLSVIQKAAKLIQRGGLIAFPTETVYGLGSDGTSPEPIRKIYEAKGRPESKPILLLIDHLSWLDQLVFDIPKRAWHLMDAFWPGPLTLTFQATSRVPKELLGGGTTIGIRQTASPIAQALCKYSNLPITAPSANLTGNPDPLTADAVRKDLGKKVGMILDGGRTNTPTLSTIIDVTKEIPYLIRPGQVSFEDILNLW